MKCSGQLQDFGQAILSSTTNNVGQLVLAKSNLYPGYTEIMHIFIFRFSVPRLLIISSLQNKMCDWLIQQRFCCAWCCRNNKCRLQSKHVFILFLCAIKVYNTYGLLQLIRREFICSIKSRLKHFQKTKSKSQYQLIVSFFQEPVNSFHLPSFSTFILVKSKVYQFTVQLCVVVFSTRRPSIYLQLKAKSLHLAFQIGRRVLCLNIISDTSTGILHNISCLNWNLHLQQFF